MSRHPDRVSVLVRLLCDPDKVEDIKTIAGKAIFKQAAAINNNSELQKMLSDWFEWMDYEKWKQKWKSDIDLDVTPIMQKHKSWVQESGITHTPTFFINGRRLPGRYNLSDLEKMIPQLSETFEVSIK